MVIVGMEPTTAEIDAAVAAAAGADAAVLFLYDAHLYASNRALLQAVQARARALAVVLLRDPYDAALLSPGVLGITAFGWRACQIEAVIARLALP
jgi:beta-N-acetylhexosaminidase